MLVNCTMRSLNPKLGMIHDFDNDVSEVMTVSDEEESVGVISPLESQVNMLTRLVTDLSLQNKMILDKIEKMNARQHVRADKTTEEEKSDLREISSNYTDKAASSLNKLEHRRPSQVIKDEFGNSFLKFSRGGTNPKGGLYSFDHGERIFLSDENKFGFVEDETCHYVRVVVDKEKYASNKKGRLKSKDRVTGAMEERS